MKDEVLLLSHEQIACHESLSVVLPAKNESMSVASVVRTLREVLPTAEVIVVCDGSSDGTADLAEGVGARVVRHPYGKGNGAAVKTGAMACCGKFVVFMDADGQHDPRDIPRLVARLREGYDMIVGARERGSQAGIGRGVANWFYNKLATYVTGHRVEDLTSGFRAARVEKFRKFLYLLPNGFSYPTTSTMAFFRAGFSVGYEPIRAARRTGSSHISPIRDGLRFLLIIFKIGTLYSPLKLFVPVASAFFLSGCGWYGYTLTMSGRFTNMSALLFSASVVIFMMGLISEQITALMYKDSADN